jgi:DNA-directed RNA polymerase specialized sigma24 family protein
VDAHTLEGCRRGEVRAFAKLLQSYQDRVYGVCVALAGGAAEAVTAATLLWAHQAVRQFVPRDRRDVGPWLLAEARKRCQARTAGAAKIEIPVAELPEGTVGDTPEARLQAARMQAAMAGAIAVLAPDLREIVALREWGWLDEAAIAGVVGIDVEEVRRRLAAGLRAIDQSVDSDAGANRGGPGVDALVRGMAPRAPHGLRLRVLNAIDARRMQSRLWVLVPVVLVAVLAGVLLTWRVVRELAK